MKRTNHRILLASVGAFFVVLLAVSLLLPKQERLLPTGSWGLSFRTEGETPVGNATPEQLAQYDAAFVGAEDAPVIYLTFDAGYENGNTEKILDVLAAHNAPAAFFVVGTYVEQNPALVRRMAAEGHTVGNHTYHHYDMSKIGDRATFESELATVAQAYEAAVGAEMPKYYRPPQGIYSEENLRMAKDLGYKTVFWSLAYQDWLQDEQPTREQAFSKLIPRIHNGAVLLLHSTSSTNAEILDELLTRYEQLGYRFGTLDALFGVSPAPADTHPDPFSAPADPTDAPADSANAPVDPPDATADPTNTTADSTNVTADSTNVTADPTNVTADSTNVTADSTNVTADSTNVTADSTNVTADSTNVTADSTNVTADSTNATADSTDTLAILTDAPADPSEASSRPAAPSSPS